MIREEQERADIQARNFLFSTFYLYSVEIQEGINSTHHGNCLELYTSQITVSKASKTYASRSAYLDLPSGQR